MRFRRRSGGTARGRGFARAPHAAARGRLARRHAGRVGNTGDGVPELPASVAKAELFTRLTMGLLKPKELAAVAQGGIIPRGRRPWEWGLEVLEELRDAKCDSDVIWGTTLAAVLRACEKGRQWALAVAVLNKARRSKKRKIGVVAHEAVLRACDAAGQWRWAILLLGEMRRTGPDPSVAAWGSAVSACDRGGESIRVLRLLDDMREEGVEPALITYSISAGACRKKMRALVNEVQERGLSWFEKPAKPKRVVL